MKELKSLAILVLLIFLSAAAYGEDLAAKDELKEKVDSLFVLANGGLEKYRDLAQPAESTLVSMGENAVRYLVPKMTTQDAREKWTLIRILGKIGKPAVAPLIQRVESADRDEAELSIRILGDIKDTVAVKPLLKLLKKESYNIRSYACESLGKIGDTTAFYDLDLRLTDSVEVVRRSAAVALGKMKETRAVPDLIRGLSDPHYGVRMTSASSLVEIGPPAAKPLLSMLNDSHDIVLYLAIQSLGELKEKQAVAPLIGKLKDQDWATRAFAVEALKQIGDVRGSRAINDLRKKEKHPFVLSKIQ
ncbi:MAG: HEAT repeat domain-containing protein [Candidatus Zixiibacteriota bacterium]